MPRIDIVIMIVLGLAACSEQSTQPKQPIRPVRTTTVTHAPTDEGLSLTGLIQATEQVSLAFRVGGRLTERSASLGDRVEPGQLVARLETQDAENNLRAAEADVAAAEAALTTAENAEARQKALLDKGVATRATYDQALQELESAKSKLKAANARLETAKDNLGYSQLHSDVAGVVIEEGAEPGEVVSAGQMILKIASGEARDAVFNVPPAILRATPSDADISVTLSNDPSVVAKGVVREVAPQADPTTGTHLVKVGLIDPPAAMTLGATVVGSAVLDPEPVIQVPGTALMETDGEPAVWLVDPTTMTVALRPIKIARYNAKVAVVSEGLQDGDIVVTAGVQALHPGQAVKFLEQPAGPGS